MSCEQRSFIARLAVDDPSALQSPLWRDHLNSCAECRKENTALGKSLAIYRHLEQCQKTDGSVDSAWSRFEHCLKGVPRPRRSLAGKMLPATAAAGLLLALMTGTVFWTQQTPTEIQPPQAVNLKPDERMHLQRVLRRSLAGIAKQSHSEPEATPKRVVPGFPVQFSRSGVVPGTTLLAPNSTITDSRTPVMLFRTLRKLRTRDDLEHYRTGESLPSQTTVPVVTPATTPAINR